MRRRAALAHQEGWGPTHVSWGLQCSWGWHQSHTELISYASRRLTCYRWAPITSHLALKTSRPTLCFLSLLVLLLRRLLCCSCSCCLPDAGCSSPTLWLPLHGSRSKGLPQSVSSKPVRHTHKIGQNAEARAVSSPVPASPRESTQFARSSFAPLVHHTNHLGFQDVQPCFDCCLVHLLCAFVLAERKCLRWGSPELTMRSHGELMECCWYMPVLGLCKWHHLLARKRSSLHGTQQKQPDCLSGAAPCFRWHAAVKPACAIPAKQQAAHARPTCTRASRPN